MSTKELIETEIQKLDEAQLSHLLQVARQLSQKPTSDAPSFMSKLKQIKIDAPEDFSANIRLCK